MTDSDDTHGRREVLKTGAVALAGASGGCLSTLPPLGQQVRYGRLDVPPADDPEYRQWIPAESALQQGVGEASSTDAMYTEPSAADSPAGREAITIGRGVMLASLDYFGIGYDNYRRALKAGNAVVAEVDVDRTVVESTLAETSYEPAGSYRGYDRYRRTDTNGTRTVAVGDGALVFAIDEDTATADAAVEGTIDAGEGRVQRYHETDDAFATLTGSLGARTFVWVYGGGLFDIFPEGMRTAGTSTVIDGNDVYYVVKAVYPSGEVPGVAAVKRALEGKERAMNAEQVDVTVDGRVASVEIRVPRSRLRDRYSSGTAIPQVTWHVEHDGSTVRFHHEAGDPVDTDRLELRPVPSADGRDPFASLGKTLDPGETVAVPADRFDDDSIRLAYVSPDGDATSVIASYDKPE